MIKTINSKLFKHNKKKNNKKRNVNKYYYPILKIPYIIMNDNGYYPDVLYDKINYCCSDMKEILTDSQMDSDYRFRLEWINNGKNKKIIIKMNLFRNNLYTANYCPMCGGKIEYHKLGIKEKIKVGCEEITEPAKTRKIYKYEWTELKKE